LRRRPREGAPWALGPFWRALILRGSKSLSGGLLGPQEYIDGPIIKD